MKNLFKPFFIVIITCASLCFATNSWGVDWDMALDEIASKADQTQNIRERSQFWQCVRKDRMLSHVQKLFNARIVDPDITPEEVYNLITLAPIHFVLQDYVLSLIATINPDPIAQRVITIAARHEIPCGIITRFGLEFRITHITRPNPIPSGEQVIVRKPTPHGTVITVMRMAQNNPITAAEIAQITEYQQQQRNGLQPLLEELQRQFQNLLQHRQLMQQPHIHQQLQEHQALRRQDQTRREEDEEKQDDAERQKRRRLQEPQQQLQLDEPPLGLQHPQLQQLQHPGPQLELQHPELQLELRHPQLQQLQHRELQLELQNPQQQQLQQHEPQPPLPPIQNPLVVDRRDDLPEPTFPSLATTTTEARLRFLALKHFLDGPRPPTLNEGELPLLPALELPQLPPLPALPQPPQPQPPPQGLDLPNFLPQLMFRPFPRDNPSSH